MLALTLAALLTLAPATAPPDDTEIVAAVEQCDVSHIVFSDTGAPVPAGVVTDDGHAVVFPYAQPGGILITSQASWEQLVCVVDVLLPEFVGELLNDRQPFDLVLNGYRVVVLGVGGDSSAVTVVIFEVDHFA